jgi:hypothetical protein
VVETGAGLVERIGRREVVLREAEPGTKSVVTEEDLPARAVRCGVLADSVESQRHDVPGRADLDIAHGEAYVVNVSDHLHQPYDASGRYSLAAAGASRSQCGHARAELR